MLNSAPEAFTPAVRTLALACGLLVEFDLPTLLALFDPPLTAVEVDLALQTWPWVRPQAGAVGRYTVEPESAQTLQLFLQNHYPAQHIQFLRRAVRYFTDQLLTKDGEARLASETALIRHLDPLCLLLADNNQIEDLARYLTEVQEAGLRVERHHQVLDFYRAVVTRERHDYAMAKTQLLRLLNQPGLAQPLRARALNALGWVCEYLCEFDRALAAYEESAELYQLLNDPIGEGKALKNQGIVYHELGLFSLAEPCYLRAYQLACQLGDSVLEMRAGLELGYTAKQLGNWATAQRYYQTGLTIAQQRADQDMVARFANNLGTVACFSGHWAQAAAHYQAALALFLNPQQTDWHEAADVCHNLGRLAAVQGEFVTAQRYFEEGLAHAHAASALPIIGELLYRSGQVCQQQHDLPAACDYYQQAIDIAERMLRQVSQEHIQIQVVGIRQQIYQAMVLCCLALGQLDAAFAFVQRAKSRAFLDLVARSSAQGVSITDLPCTVDELQAVLPPDAALVEFFITGESSPGEPFLDHLPPETRHLRDRLLPVRAVLAFVVTAQTLAVVYLEAAIEPLKARLFDPVTKRLRGTEPADTLSTLSRWHQVDTFLLDPVRPYLEHPRQLVLAPHSLLHYLPLHAVAKEGRAFSADVSYIPSASLFRQVRAEHRLSKLAPAVLAVGVDGTGLRYSAAEAAWVADFFSGQCLLGAEATVGVVSTQLQQAQVIHISCHGHFSDAQPMRSGLELFDGQLTAADILHLAPLPAELVVLSACETGLNQLMPGDELMGFTRALLGAGVRSVLMTLWRVEELPTRLFIEAFYRSWQAGASMAAAVTAAQQTLQLFTVDQLHTWLSEMELPAAVIHDEWSRFAQRQPGPYPFAHPYYWSAFILVGDPG